MQFVTEAVMVNQRILF